MESSSPPRTLIGAGRVSPVVRQTAEHSSRISCSRSLFSWSAVNFIASVILFGELRLQTFQCWLGVRSTLVWYGLLVLSIIFILNALIDFCQAAYSTFVSSPLTLSSAQKRLMGMKMADSITMVTTPPSRSVIASSPARKLFNLANLVKPRQQQTSTPVNQGHTFSRHSSSSTPSQGSSFQTSPGSPSYRGNVTGASCSISDSFPGHGVTSHSAPLDGSSYIDSSGGSPFLRHRRSPFIHSPLPSEDYMTEQKALNNYLKSMFEKEESKSHLHGFDSSLGASPGYWSYGSSFLDYSVELSRNLYQLSTRSPKSTTTSKSNKDDQSKMATMEYWIQSGVDRNCLVEWVARLRRWLSLTVLRGVVKECNKVNAQLKHIGCPEIQIGESSLSALKQIHQSKASQVPTLTWLLPYLEVTQNQEYLFQRIKTLAAGGYMSEYRWDKGGKTKGREWAEDLPTDSAVVMHIFCVYMDVHLPPHPRYPDGKAFTSQYFVQSPHKPNPSSSAKMQIFQSKLLPPHYQLVTKERTYDPASVLLMTQGKEGPFGKYLSCYGITPKCQCIFTHCENKTGRGRHNLFMAILFFLHWIKTKESSMLGQVNLGLSGINLLCVIEPTSRTRATVLPSKEQSSTG